MGFALSPQHDCISYAFTGSYEVETLQVLPEVSDAVFIAHVVFKRTERGRVHRVANTAYMAKVLVEDYAKAVDRRHRTVQPGRIYSG